MAIRDTFHCFVKSFFVFALVAALGACTQFSSVLQKPHVALENIALANNNLLSPRFKLTIRITNPNGVALPVKGMSYSINIQGVDVFEGVTSKIPNIAAYSDTVIDLELGTDIIKAARLLRAFKDRTDNNVNYGLNAHIDLTGILPSFNVSDTGFVVIP